MARVISRGGYDRRTGMDRRSVYNIAYFEQGGIERRAFDERRGPAELRDGWVRVTQWSSVLLDGAGFLGEEEAVLAA